MLSSSATRRQPVILIILEADIFSQVTEHKQPPLLSPSGFYANVCVIFLQFTVLYRKYVRNSPLTETRMTESPSNFLKVSSPQLTPHAKLLIPKSL